MDFEEKSKSITRDWVIEWNEPGGEAVILAALREAYDSGRRDGMECCLRAAERELNYREYLDREDPGHCTNHPVTACKEIIGAIRVGIQQVPTPPAKETSGG